MHILYSLFNQDISWSLFALKHPCIAFQPYCRYSTGQVILYTCAVLLLPFMRCIAHGISVRHCKLDLLIPYHFSNWFQTLAAYVHSENKFSTSSSLSWHNGYITLSTRFYFASLVLVASRLLLPRQYEQPFWCTIIGPNQFSPFHLSISPLICR